MKNWLTAMSLCLVGLLVLGVMGNYGRTVAAEDSPFLSTSAPAVVDNDVFGIGIEDSLSRPISETRSRNIATALATTVTTATAVECTEHCASNNRGTGSGACSVAISRERTSQTLRVVRRPISVTKNVAGRIVTTIGRGVRATAGCCWNN